MTGECVRLVRDELIAALLSISLKALQDIPHPEFARFDAELDAGGVSDDETFEDDINAPYLWWFHRRDEIEAASRTLPKALYEHFTAFRNYIYDSMTQEWSQVEVLLEGGRITREYLHYLFVGSDVSTRFLSS